MLGCPRAWTQQLQHSMPTCSEVAAWEGLIQQRRRRQDFRGGGGCHRASPPPARQPASRVWRPLSRRSRQRF